MIGSLSIVIETQTQALATDAAVAANLRETLAQARALSNVDVEVLLVSDGALDDVPEGARNVVAPGARYYALKNAGFRAARGEIVLFNDSDTLLAPGYLEALRRAADHGPEDWAFGGRTVYGGDGVLTRINTVFSFGHLHTATGHDWGNRPVMSHNVAVRRAQAPAEPFGPSVGRVGGDAYLTEHYRLRGRPVRVVPGMRLAHHDISGSLRLILERHLRDLLWDVTSEPELRPWRRTGLAALARAALSPVWRGRQLWRHGRAVGLSAAEHVVGAAVIAAYAELDLLSLVVLETVPAARRAWLRYQNGSV